MTAMIHQSEPLRGQAIRHSDMTSFASLIGTGYRATTPRLGPGSTVANGTFRLIPVRPGLLVHASDACHVRAVSTQVLKPAGLNISVVLNGRWAGAIGGRPIACGGGTPEGFLFSLAEPDLWVRHSQRGVNTRMVNVMVTPEWLDLCGLGEVTEGAAAIVTFCRHHLAAGAWRPSAKTIAYSEQILKPPPGPAFIQQLYVESRAIEIVRDVLGAINGEPEAASSTQGTPSDYRRMRGVREWIEANLAQPISLGILARQAGVSIAALQRQFNTVYGTTVFGYLRTRRLRRARELLECEGKSVSEAAYDAGYKNPANFATAFKRHFGISPKQLRVKT
jgi:AraC-like DNA-binding protein